MWTAYHMLDTMLSTLRILSPLIFTRTLWWQCYYYPHLAEREIEVALRKCAHVRVHLKDSGTRTWTVALKLQISVGKFPSSLNFSEYVCNRKRTECFKKNFFPSNRNCHASHSPTFNLTPTPSNNSLSPQKMTEKNKN